MSDTFPIVLEPALINEFSERGFVVTPDVLSRDELAIWGTAVDAEVAERNAHDTRAVGEKNLYEQSFVQCMRLWETNPTVADLTFHPGLAGIAAQLLGVPSVLLWQDQALYKEAGGRETTPHQDLTFWPIGESKLVSAWIPFNRVGAANGAMAYVPGSHKAGRLKVVDITHSTEPYAILDDPALGGTRPELVAVDPGSVVWHHGLTVHEATANTTEQTRRVFTIVYISADARRTREWPAYPLERAGVGVGELIRGEGMPRVWPPLEVRPRPPAQIGTPTGPQY